MTTLETQHRSEGESSKIVPIKKVENEISPEDFSEIIRIEEQKFKQETQDEISKLNSVNLEESTFENIKKDTNIVQELNDINKEFKKEIIQAQLEYRPSLVLSGIDSEVLDRNRIRHDGLVGPTGKENLRKIRNEIYREYDEFIPNFSKAMLDIDKIYEDKILHIDERSKELHTQVENLSVKGEEIRNRLIQEKNILQEDEYEKLFDELHDIFNQEKPLNNELELLWQEKSKIPLDKKKSQEAFLLEDNKEALNNDEIVVVSQDDRENRKPIDDDMHETLLLGKKLSDFPENIQIQYKESVKKYSDGLNAGMREKDKDGLTDVDKARNDIRYKYDEVINKLGIVSSDAGKADNWIYWDLGKQSYLSAHKEESNQKYTVANPFNTENHEIVKDIVDRHVGWEILGYVKNNPEFLNLLDKSQDSYMKIKALLDEGLQNNKLPSYKLSQLGHLAQRNKGIGL